LWGVFFSRGKGRDGDGDRATPLLAATLWCRHLSRPPPSDTRARSPHTRPYTLFTPPPHNCKNTPPKTTRHHHQKNDTQSRRAALAGAAALVAAVAAPALPAMAAYGDAANVFGRVTNQSGFVPYAGEGFAVLLPSRWNPSKEKDFGKVAETVLR